METEDGDFALKNCHAAERFRFAMSNETLFIRVQGTDKPFTFMADRSEAKALRDWLNTNLSE